MRPQTTNKAFRIAIAVLVLASVCQADRASAAWTWEYSDDFSTDKAKHDSYEHSIFWPENAIPPAEPYLFYASRQGNPAPGLMLMGYRARPAHLNYCFPLESLQPQAEIAGILTLDVQFPLNVPGGLSYSISPDGKVWTLPTILPPGHHRIRLGSSQGTCYVSFIGSGALIDNLEVSLTGGPRTLVVPLDYRTIQEAIDAAQAGDTVEVLPGTYTGKGNRDIELRGKAITVRGRGGPDETIIDCRGASEEASRPGHRGFYIHEAETARTCVEGFTIRQGRIPGSDLPADSMRWNLDPSHPIGAGIYCEFTSPTIRKCVVEGCSTEMGGGIGCVGGTPSIETCRITDCTAGGTGNSKSGGMGGGIGLIRECRASIAHCQVVFNSGYWNSCGGGLYCRKAQATVEDCEVLRNSAPGTLQGGGVYVGVGSTVELRHCVIAENAASAGGGVFTEVEANTTGRGAATAVRIRNCTIAHNRLSGPQMPPFPGGGVHSLESDTTLRNSIVWYNEGTQVLLIDPPCESPVVYCDVEHGYPGAGNMDKNPLFALDTASYPLDYHLQSVVGRYDPRTGTWVRDRQHSPCIDAGDPTEPVGEEPRPNGGRINMGAYGGTWQASKSRSTSPGITPTDTSPSAETEATPDTGTSEEAT